jgi:hypothetical protein
MFEVNIWAHEMTNNNGMKKLHNEEHHNLYSSRNVGKYRVFTRYRRKYCISFRSPSLFYLLVHSRCRGCLFSLDHTQTHTTVGRAPLGEGSARRRDLYLTTQTLYKRKTSMPPVGFEPTIPASARPQTYALDRAATGIDKYCIYLHTFLLT